MDLWPTCIDKQCQNTWDVTEGSGWTRQGLLATWGAVKAYLTAPPCGGSWTQTVGICVIVQVKRLRVPCCWHTEPTWEETNTAGDRVRADEKWCVDVLTAVYFCHTQTLCCCWHREASLQTSHDDFLTHTEQQYRARWERWVIGEKKKKRKNLQQTS